MVFDTLLLGGTVIDGSGAAGFRADVGILDGKIAAVGNLSAARAGAALDVSGRLVTPGFIDIHRHADTAVFRDGFGKAELSQGLTTIINGNCGLSIAPSAGEYQSAIFDYLAPVTGRPEAWMQTDTMAGYLARLQKTELSLNVGMLVGGGTVRAQAAGFGAERLEDAQFKAIHRALERALSDGALGVSLGLGYAPECFYTPQELLRALAPLKDSGVLVTVHMRQEGSGVEEALAEMIGLARRLHTPFEISHLKSIGCENWRKSTPAMLRKLRRAREEGLDIACDVYPYTAGSTQLVHILPPESQQGGLAQLTENLKKPDFRARMRARMETGDDFENIAKLVGWENIVAGSVPGEKNRRFEGKSIAEIAAIEQKDPFDAAFDLLQQEQCAVSMIDFITAEEDIEAILQDEASCVISDSTYPLTGLYHPRVYGTYARLFARYVREKKTLRVEQAVHKITARPAQRLHLAGKGVLTPGMDADINVFRLEDFQETATYSSPCQMAAGMEYVFVAGKAAIFRGALTGRSCGKVLEDVKC